MQASLRGTRDPLQSARIEALRQGRLKLDAVRAQFPGAPSHRAIRHQRLDSVILLETLAIGTSFAAALLWLQEPLAQWWEAIILMWAGALDIPLAATAAGTLEWRSPDTLLPGLPTGIASAAGVVMIYWATYWMPDSLTPLKYLLRTFCVVQASALVFFGTVPSLFPYTVGGHIDAILACGYTLMLSAAGLMALGYGILSVPLWFRVVHPALLLAYFAVALPHQAVLHALLLQHLSLIFMPLLYLCFGIVFNMMIFMALYSWLVSLVPVDAIS